MKSVFIAVLLGVGFVSAAHLRGPEEQAAFLTRCEQKHQLRVQARYFTSSFLELSGNVNRPEESVVDPDCPEEYHALNGSAHAQFEVDGKHNFTHTPERLQQLNHDELSEMKEAARQLEVAMRNQSIAKFWLDRAQKELKDRIAAATVCMNSARVAVNEAFENFNRKDSVKSIDAMLSEGVNKTECSQEKVDQIIPQRKLVNAKQAEYDLATAIRVNTEKHLRALDKRRFDAAEEMCRKLMQEEKSTKKTVLIRLAKIVNDTRAVRLAVEKPQPGQDTEAMLESVVLGNRAAAKRKMLLEQLRKQAAHVCERDRVLRLERGLGSNETTVEVFKTIDHSIKYKDLAKLRTEAEIASDEARKMRVKAGLFTSV